MKVKVESRQGRASGPNGPFQESKAFLHFHTVGDMTSPRLCKNGPKLEIHSSWNVNSLRHSSNWENLGNITSKISKHPLFIVAVAVSKYRLCPVFSPCVVIVVLLAMLLQLPQLQLSPHIDQVSVQHELPF